MGLLDFFSKAKKKLTDTIGGLGAVANTFRNDLSNTANNVENNVARTSRSVMDFSQSAPQKVENYFTPTVQRTSDFIQKMPSNTQSYFQKSVMPKVQRNVYKPMQEKVVAPVMDWSKQANTTVQRTASKVGQAGIDYGFKAPVKLAEKIGTTGVDTISKAAKFTAEKPFQAVANVATLGNYNRVVNDKKVKDYFAPAPQMRARDIVREIPKGINETAKGAAQGAARFAISLAELPKTLATSKASGKYYNTPVGRINSFQSEAQNRVEKGDPLWKAIGNPALDTVLAGADIGAVAKPILNTVKSLSRSGSEVANIVDDLTKPLAKTMKQVIPARTEPVSPNIFDAQPGQGTFKIVKDKLKKVDGFQMTRDAKPFNMPEQTIDVPFEFKSNLLKSAQRPGLTIKDVSGGKPSFDEKILAKNREAQKVVNNQIENQKAGLPKVEPGFVAPENLPVPKNKPKATLTVDEYVNGQKEAPSAPVAPKQSRKPVADINEFVASKNAVKKSVPDINEWVNGLDPKVKKIYQEAIKPLPPLKKGEVNLDQAAEYRDAYGVDPKRTVMPSIDEYIDKKTGEIISKKPVNDSPFENDMFSKPRAGEVIEKNLNNRPHVKQTDTVEEIYNEYIKNADVPSKKLAENTKDLLETTPGGSRTIFDPNETNIVNYSHQLSLMGKTRKEISKIGFEEGKKMIDDWKIKSPEYFKKKEEIERFKNFVSDYKSSEEKGIKRGLEYLTKYSDIPSNKGSQVIHFLENPGQAPADVAPHVQNLKNEFNAFFNEAKDAGLEVGNWRDYVTHIWAESPQVVAKKIRDGLKRGIITAEDIATPSVSSNPFFRPSNARTLKTYELGERIGLHMKYDQPAQIVAHYAKELEKAKSVISNVNVLKESGDIVDGVQNGMKPLTAPGMEGMSAEPELANKLNNAFRDQSLEYYDTVPGKILEKAAGASRWLKETLMSGGIPMTTVNSYGISMTLKEIGTLSPTRAYNAISSFLVANNPSASRKFFIDNVGQVEKIKSQDLGLSTMLDNGGFIDKGFWSNLLGEGVPFTKNSNHWEKIINEPTFGRFLPMNQIKFFNSIESRLLKQNYSPEDAIKIAAKELKEGMGLGSQSNKAAQTQWSKDLMETAFFAPTHRANMFRVFGNALKTFGRNPFKPGNQSGAQFLVGGMAVYGMYDWVNYKNTGHHLWDNPEGKKFEAYISTGNGNFISIPFMPSVATMPRLGIDVAERVINPTEENGGLKGALVKAWQGSGSLLSKPLADIAMNSDYFGRDIANTQDDPSKQYLDQGKYLAKSYTGHPWIKAGIDAAGGKPLGQVAVQATEAPIRFTTDDKLASGKFFEEFYKVRPVYNKYIRLSKEDPAKAEEFYKENQKIIESYPKLNDAKSMYSVLKDEGVQDQFGGLMKNDGFNFAEKPKTGYMTDVMGNPINTANAQGPSLPLMPTSSTGSSIADRAVLDNKIKQEMDLLARSNENFKDLGNGWVLRMGEDGLPKKQRRDSFDAELNTAKLKNFKRNEDLKGWMEFSQKQLDLLNKRMNDPSIDDLDKVKIQDDLDALIENHKDFSDWGGFKKGQSASTKGAKVLAKSDADTNLRMDRAISKNDLKAWSKAADSKIEAIDAYMSTLNPDTDMAKIDSLTLKKENLLDKAKKYAEQEGFKAQEKLEEKFKYKLVDPEMLRINALIAGNTARKPVIRKRSLQLMQRALPTVHRTTSR